MDHRYSKKSPREKFVSLGRVDLELINLFSLSLFFAIEESKFCVLAKGLSSFVAGQLLSQLSMSLKQMFQLSATVATIGSSVFYMIYVIFGRKPEAKLIAQVKEKRRAMEEAAKPPIELQEDTYI